MGKECLKRFFDHCCSVSYYAFGVKKCGQASCNICKPVRLPSDIFKTLHFLPQPQAKGEHYASFDELYGVPTTEKDRPSLKNVQCKGAHGIPFSPNNQTARNVSECVMCGECLRPRVLHSKHKISFKDQKVLLQTLEDILFSCGASFKEVSPSIQPEDRSEAASSIFNRVFVRENLSCEMPVEVTYFSSESFVDICVHCACINSTQAALTLPVGAYPICSVCVEDGKDKIFKRKRPVFKGPTSSSYSYSFQLALSALSRQATPSYPYILKWKLVKIPRKVTQY